MSASTGATPITAPDSYGAKPGDAGYFYCPGASVVTLSVYNAAIVWQAGIAEAQSGAPVFDGQPEVNAGPSMRSMARRVDAIRFRAAVAAASLPAGQAQATVSIDAR